MPRRLNTRKWATKGLQGPKSFIEFKYPYFVQRESVILDLHNIRDEKTATEVSKLKDQLKTEESEETKTQIRIKIATLQVNGTQDIEIQTQDYLMKLAIKLFHDWNWADENGEPLKPLNEYSVEELRTEEILIVPEFTFIISCIQKLLTIEFTDEKKDI